MGENIRDADLTVGTTALMAALAPHPNKRTALAFTNTSITEQILSLGFGKAAIAGRGIILYPGGSWSESVDSRFSPTNKEIWVISSATGGTLAIHERLETRGI